MGNVFDGVNASGYNRIWKVWKVASLVLFAVFVVCAVDIAKSMRKHAGR